MFNKKLKEEIEKINTKLNGFSYIGHDWAGYDVPKHEKGLIQKVNGVNDCVYDLEKKVKDLTFSINNFNYRNKVLLEKNKELHTKIQKQQALLNELIDYVYSKEKK